MSENQRFSDVFRWYRNEIFDLKWLKQSLGESKVKIKSL